MPAIGRSDVTVEVKTAPIAEGRINLAFQINEGERTKIKDISFRRQQRVQQQPPALLILTKESGIFSFPDR